MFVPVSRRAIDVERSNVSPWRLELSGVAAGYKRRGAVLENVNLAVGDGLTIIIGANGAGKSTLLRTIATSLEAQAGNISVDGVSVSGRRGLARARRNIGYVPQHSEFPGNFVVDEFLLYGATLRRAPDVRRAVSDAVARFGLNDLRRRPLAKLSGGERQRVFLAEATVADPGLVLLDEPSAGLDIPTCRALLATLEEQSASKCVVMTTHLVEDVSRQRAMLSSSRAARSGE